jgi:hypothetical protein
MNGTDQAKLVNAGYTIIRKEDHLGATLRIKYKGTGSHEWRTLEKGFKTKVALERRMCELLKISTVIED